MRTASISTLRVTPPLRTVIAVALRAAIPLGAAIASSAVASSIGTALLRKGVTKRVDLLEGIKNPIVFVVGVGNSNSSRQDGFKVGVAGSGWFNQSVSATAFNTRSDRRLKEHIADLDDDAVEFIRALRPVLFSWKKNGARHTGFYAQDVKEALPDAWETDTVGVTTMGRESDINPLTLDYQSLIAPLVAYCQHLEERIKSLEKGRGYEHLQL